MPRHMAQMQNKKTLTSNKDILSSLNFTNQAYTKFLKLLARMEKYRNERGFIDLLKEEDEHYDFWHHFQIDFDGVNNIINFFNDEILVIKLPVSYPEKSNLSSDFLEYFFKDNPRDELKEIMLWANKTWKKYK